MDLAEVPPGGLRRHPWEIARAESVLRAIGPGECASAVDVGAGDRYFLGRLSRRSAARLTAVDTGYNQPVEADGVRLLTSVSGLADASQDLALLMDVLEHSRDDGALLGAVFRKVRPGGRLIVTVPAFPWLYSRHDVSLGHLRRYRRRRLSELTRQLTGERAEIFHFFGALFPVRGLQVLLERLGFRTTGRGIGGWPHAETHPLTRILVALLVADFTACRRLARCGLHLPGLSLCLIIRKRSAS